MENLLPSFTQVPADEPSSTQMLAQFSFPASLPPPQTPPQGTRGVGNDVVADLLNNAQADRVNMDPNRLATATPEAFDKHPVEFKPIDVTAGPYYGKEEVSKKRKV